MVVPKQDLPVYAKDRLEKAEDENAKLREQVARSQRQRQDLETFYEKRMAEQKIESERAQERKLAEQQRDAVLKQHRARVEEEAVTALRKQILDFQKEIERFKSQKKETYGLGSPPEIEGQGTNTGEVGQSLSELEKARQDLMRERDRTTGSSLLPPLPHPLHPVSSLRKIDRWLFGGG